jgi:hypothetical protein
MSRWRTRTDHFYVVGPSGEQIRRQELFILVIGWQCCVSLMRKQSNEPLRSRGKILGALLCLQIDIGDDVLVTLESVHNSKGFMFYCTTALSLLAHSQVICFHLGLLYRPMSLHSYIVVTLW